MAKRKREKTVATLRHEEASRKNIPTAEVRSVMEGDEQRPVQVAYQRRNRDLDPQLVWRGKDAQDWSDLVVQAPPLFIQEKVHPKVLIDDLRRQRRSGRDGQGGDGTEVQPDLFADFNGLPSDDARTEFYQHDANWSNRMILGDSLQVMASLAEREGLRVCGRLRKCKPFLSVSFCAQFALVVLRDNGAAPRRRVGFRGTRASLLAGPQGLPARSAVAVTRRAAAERRSRVAA